VYYLTTITSAYFKRISIACRQGRFRCLCLQVSDWILVAQCDLLLRMTFFLGCQTSMLFRERTKGKLKIPQHFPEVYRSLMHQYIPCFVTWAFIMIGGVMDVYLCNGKYDKAMELRQLQITYFKSIKTTLSFAKVMRELRIKEQ
jgi:hypothetical protein